MKFIAIMFILISANAFGNFQVSGYIDKSDSLEGLSISGDYKMGLFSLGLGYGSVSPETGIWDYSISSVDIHGKLRMVNSSIVTPFLSAGGSHYTKRTGETGKFEYKETYTGHDFGAGVEVSMNSTFSLVGDYRMRYVDGAGTPSIRLGAGFNF